ncbi:uncharacterized protein LOC126455747 [Schistocerca serialis cubense]|uniref:uncharacterized protein LOC126455747 n=1 Tax=Schistocerca serialis cubense TaxID=2023355 RepID=UPI00214E3925|nr:uncharacterized protein LOC126455747 [Schistocerca serialis cubense]
MTGPCESANSGSSTDKDETIPLTKASFAQERDISSAARQPTLSLGACCWRRISGSLATGATNWPPPVLAPLSPLPPPPPLSRNKVGGGGVRTQITCRLGPCVRPRHAAVNTQKKTPPAPAYRRSQAEITRVPTWPVASQRACRRQDSYSRTPADGRPPPHPTPNSPLLARSAAAAAYLSRPHSPPPPPPVGVADLVRGRGPRPHKGPLGTAPQPHPTPALRCPE